MQDGCTLPAVGTQLATYLGERAAVLGQVLFNQGLHTHAGNQVLLHVTILPATEEGRSWACLGPATLLRLIVQSMTRQPAP